MKQEIKTSIHNRFDIYKTNRETGKTEQIAYAENIVLDAMWPRLVNRLAYFGAIQFGTGTGTLVSSRTSLFSFLGAKTAIDDVLTRTVPTASWRRKIVLNPEDNVGAVLTEIGIGYDTTTGHLVTHAMLRDMNGNIVSITKTAVDLLTIYATVYITFLTSHENFKICGLPNNNPLMNFLVGGAAFGNMYFYTGEMAKRSNEYSPAIYSTALGTSSAVTWTIDLASKKITTNTYRFGVDASNGHVAEVGFGSGVNTPIFRASLPAAGIYDGLPLSVVPIGTGDNVTTEFLLPSKNVRRSTLKVYVDNVETADYSIIESFGDPMQPYREVFLATTAGSEYKTGKIARTTGDMANVSKYSPYFMSWKRNGNDFIRRANPAITPTGIGNCAALSADGTVLAIAHATAPYITTYDLVNDAWVKRLDPIDLPTGQGNGCALSDNGLILAVAHTTSPYITTYDWSDGAWVKQANPESLPTGTGNGCSLSGSGSILAVAHATSPFITTYDWSEGSWIKRENPTDLPVTAGNACDLNADGSVLAVAFTGSPFWRVYDWTGSVWVSRAIGAWSAGGYGYGISISNDGKIVGVATHEGPYNNGAYCFLAYEWVDSAWVQFENNMSWYNWYSKGRSVSVFPDGSQVFVGMYHTSDGQDSIKLFNLSKRQTKIRFNAAPATGVVISADYTVDGLHKTTQRVIDLNASFTFGEPI